MYSNSNSNRDAEEEEEGPSLLSPTGSSDSNNDSNDEEEGSSIIYDMIFWSMHWYLFVFTLIDCSLQEG